MKALTISQPFASLIANGEKFVENRIWGTSYRGILLIHVGKGSQYLDRKELAEYPTGAIIAVAKLVACLPLGPMQFVSRDREIPGTKFTIGEVLDHKHTEGPWCWILESVRRVEPIPIRGLQKIWEADIDNDFTFLDADFSSSHQ